MPEATDHRRAIERAVAEVVSRQHGVIARRQLLAAGIGQGAIEHRLRSGRLFRVGHGVYSLTPAVDSKGRAMTAVLAAAPRPRRLAPSRRRSPDPRNAVRVDGSVAVAGYWALHVLELVPRPVGRVTIATVGDRASRGRGIDGHRARQRGRQDLVWTEGIPVVSAPRSILDIAPGASPAALRRILREAQFRRVLSDQALADAIQRSPNHPGISALRRVDPDLMLRLAGMSPLEGDLAVFLENETDLGPWQSQYPVALSDGPTYRLDHARPDLKLAVEADGADAHLTTQGRRHDATRDAALLAEGWVTVRVMSHHLAHERHELRRHLHAIAARRGWRPGSRP